MGAKLALSDSSVEFADKFADVFVGFKTDNDFAAALIIFFDADLLRENLLELLDQFYVLFRVLLFDLFLGRFWSVQHFDHLFDLTDGEPFFYYLFKQGHLQFG